MKDKFNHVYTGYAVVFNKVDLQHDLIVPGEILFNGMVYNEQSKQTILGGIWYDMLSDE